MIASIRRGRALDELTLFAVDGRALHVVAYGYTPDEARRTREALVRWFIATGIPVVDDEGRPL